MSESTNSQSDVRTRSPTVDILDPDVYQWLSDKAKKDDTSLRKLVKNMLEMQKEKEEFIAEYIQPIKKISFEDGLLYLRDNSMKKTATISLLDGFIQCDVCDSKECIHVLYAMTLPEIARLERISS